MLDLGVGGCPFPGYKTPGIIFQKLLLARLEIISCSSQGAGAVSLLGELHEQMCLPCRLYPGNTSSSRASLFFSI